MVAVLFLVKIRFYIVDFVKILPRFKISAMGLLHKWAQKLKTFFLASVLIKKFGGIDSGVSFGVNIYLWAR